MASTPQESSNLKRQLENSEDSSSPNKKSKTETTTENQSSWESDFNSLPVELLQTETNGTSPAPAPATPIDTTNASSTKERDQDTSKLNDAIAAAGVDIQQEEEILLQQQLNRKSAEGMASNLKSVIRSSKLPPFLHNYHLAAFIDKVAKQNGIQQNFLMDGEMLELISAACETWLSNLATKR